MLQILIHNSLRLVAETYSVNNRLIREGITCISIFNWYTPLYNRIIEFKLICHIMLNFTADYVFNSILRFEVHHASSAFTCISKWIYKPCI